MRSRSNQGTSGTSRDVMKNGIPTPRFAVTLLIESYASRPRHASQFCGSFPDARNPGRGGGLVGIHTKQIYFCCSFDGRSLKDSYNSTMIATSYATKHFLRNVVAQGPRIAGRALSTESSIFTSPLVGSSLLFSTRHLDRKSYLRFTYFFSLTKSGTMYRFSESSRLSRALLLQILRKPGENLGKHTT